MVVLDRLGYDCSLLCNIDDYSFEDHVQRRFCMFCSSDDQSSVRCAGNQETGHCELCKNTCTACSGRAGRMLLMVLVHCIWQWTLYFVVGIAWEYMCMKV